MLRKILTRQIKEQSWPTQAIRVKRADMLHAILTGTVTQTITVVDFHQRL
jgi:hypothetical protein